MQPESKVQACSFCDAALTDEIYDFVPQDFFSAVLCFGCDDTFLMRTRDTYPDNFLMYIDEPNAIRLFKERHRDYANRMYINPLPLNNVSALRFDLILSANILSYFTHNLREMIHYSVFSMLTDDGYFAFCEKRAEIDGQNVVEIISTYMNIERSIVHPNYEIAGICRKKGIYG